VGHVIRVYVTKSNISTPKSCEEDEYALIRWYREREKLRARPHAGVEWTSEPLTERRSACSFLGTST